MIPSSEPKWVLWLRNGDHIKCASLMGHVLGCHELEESWHPVTATNNVLRGVAFGKSAEIPAHPVRCSQTTDGDQLKGAYDTCVRIDPSASEHDLCDLMYLFWHLVGIWCRDFLVVVPRLWNSLPRKEKLPPLIYLPDGGQICSYSKRFGGLEEGGWVFCL